MPEKQREAGTGTGGATGDKGDDAPTPTTLLEVSKEKTDAVINAGTGAASKQAVLAKLSEFSKQKTDDPYRTIAIELMTRRLTDSDKAEA